MFIAATAVGPDDGVDVTDVRGVDNEVVGSTLDVVGKNVRVGLVRVEAVLESMLAVLAEVVEVADKVELDDAVEEIEEDELLLWALLLGTNMRGRSSGIGEFRLF